MQTPHRFLTTQHRRRRLALWAAAMLSWVAAVLFAGRDVTVRLLRQRYERVSIERLTRLVINLLIIRARELAPVRKGKLRYWRHGRHLVARHFIRSLIGSKLRRVLKHKDLATRVANLIRVLRNLDAAARQLGARMKRRLTRLSAIKPARLPADALVSLAAPTLAFADSS
jgi:hypothetical protein